MKFDLEKHRDNLIKYCYDLSKIIATVAVINQLIVYFSYYSLLL